MKARLIAVVLLLIGSAADAQIGPSSDGVIMLSTAPTGIGSSIPIGPGHSDATGAAPPVGTCLGVIDLSAGCTLGVIP